ncbi:MAG: choice-of-anchor L domain-containing protein [Proteobacteria bacterium]|nr:choice-of-anchor L domain-containing protein [Pseudomonadota bacterium]
MKKLTACLSLILCLFMASCDDEQTKKDCDTPTTPSDPTPGDPSEPLPPKVVEAVGCTAENCKGTCCGDVCRDTTSNSKHCGVCGHACNPTEACIDSVCTVVSTGTCAEDELRCGADCIKIYRNKEHCGDCDTVCGDNQACIDGKCVIQCGEDLTRCCETCVDVLTNALHCSACGYECPDGNICVNAMCTNDCGVDTQTVCGHSCVTLSEDSDNCGTCGRVCAEGQACVEGECSETCMNPDETVCNRMCVDVLSSNSNCGACGNACPGNTRCSEGACVSTCDEENAIICNHDCLDPSSDNDNCGGCGKVCTARQMCVEGACVDTCEGEGQAICDHACIDVMSDAKNCGDCEKACLDGEICREGACGCPDEDPYCNVPDPKCEEGEDVCNHFCTNKLVDVHHCGTCGNDCGENGMCYNGRCIDCTNKTGCEDGLCYDLQNDPNNCGACGAACPSHVACIEGQCAACQTNYVDCNKDMADGCEKTTAECDCSDGETRSCYYGPTGTVGVGACKAGTQTCVGNRWGDCVGMVVPVTDFQCRKDIKDKGLNDLNCDGKVDGMEDYDGDGISICGGDCCDIKAQCPNVSDAKLVRPGFYEVPGNNIDDNCNGRTDESVTTCAATYSQGNNLGNVDNRNYAGLQLAHAMDICDDASVMGYGLVSATVQSLNSNILGNTLMSYAINVFSQLPNKNPVIKPKSGSTFAGISSGSFYVTELSHSNDFIEGGTIPPKYHSAHGNSLQSHPQCSTSNNINDSVDLKLTLKAPINATGFQFDFRFYSHEYPEYVCTPYNDFFIALLGSKALGIPADTNIVFDKNGAPVSINNAFFTSCEPIYCSSSCLPVYSSCTGGKCMTAYGACPDGTADLAAWGGGGGATAWLTTKAPVIGGETFTLDFIIWDTDDDAFDSAAIIDNFRWITTGGSVTVGTEFTDPRT